MLLVTQGVRAQTECFIFGDVNQTIIKGLTEEGMAAIELTIPGSVELVKAGAFAYASSTLTDLTVDGGNPEFESDVLSAVKFSLKTINVGNGMTATNIKTMLATLGAREALETVVIEGFVGTSDVVWDDMTNELTSAVHVILPATLVNYQEFGNAKVYGRFTINGELATTCVNASFVDVDDGSNFLFYIPISVEDENRIKIQRVKYIQGRKGVMIHNTTGTAVNADLLLDDGTDSTRRKQDNETYQSNMLVGVTSPTTIGATDGNNTNLILYQGAFHPISGGTIPANRAYLQIPTNVWDTMNVRQLTFNFDDLETGIDIVTEDINVTGIYDLTGRKVSIPRKGVYIRNGRKSFIK